MSNLKEAMERFNAQPITVLSGVVTQVRPDEDTCDVLPDNGNAEMLDVALLNGIYPAEGAQVLVGAVEGRRTDAFLISADRITHYRMATEKEDALRWLLDLLTALRKLTVTTPAGPSGVPINLAEFEALAQRLQNLFRS